MELTSSLILQRVLNIVRIPGALAIPSSELSPGCLTHSELKNTKNIAVLPSPSFHHPVLLNVDVQHPGLLLPTCTLIMATASLDPNFCHSGCNNTLMSLGNSLILPTLYYLPVWPISIGCFKRKREGWTWDCPTKTLASLSGNAYWSTHLSISPRTGGQRIPSEAC